MVRAFIKVLKSIQYIIIKTANCFLLSRTVFFFSFGTLGSVSMKLQTSGKIQFTCYCPLFSLSLAIH